MREIKKIKFSAIPVLIISLVAAVALMVIQREFLSSTENMVLLIIGDLINVLAGAVISAVVINFFLSISTERDMIDRIHANIAKNTDYQALSMEGLYEVNLNLTKELLRKRSGNSSISEVTDLQLMAEDLAQNYWLNICDNTYLKKYDRIVTITVEDTCVHVKTDTTITYHNITDVKSKYFSSAASFLNEKDAKSYKISKMIYHNIDQTEQYTHISLSREKNGSSWIASPPTIDISKAGDHAIKYITEYETAPSCFFQSVTMQHNCKNFHVSAILNDRRKNKNGTYKLRWNIICSPPEKRKNALNIFPSLENRDNIHLGKVDWFPKGGGYVLTLSREEKENEDAECLQ